MYRSTFFIRFQKWLRNIPKCRILFIPLDSMNKEIKMA